MKIKTTLIQCSPNGWHPYRLTAAGVMLCALLSIAGMGTSLKAQLPQYTYPSWWFGLAGAGNINFYTGSTQRLTSTVVAPVPFNQGMGLGLYLAPVVEYRAPTSNWGITLQAAYDSRRGTYETEYSPCNCPRDLQTKMSYLTFEPTLRFSPWKSQFYLFAGPRLAYNVRKSFIYEMGTNPDYPEQVKPDPIKGDLSEVNPMLFSGQVGAGYDIRLTEKGKKTQLVLSPFASFHPYFGQAPRAIETWSVTTVRIGAALKLGCGKLIPQAEVRALEPPAPLPAPELDVDFTVYAPTNVAAQRSVRETFPLHNDVFFDAGSTKIPNRYVTLRSDQVSEFKEESVQLNTPKNLSGRSDRQMEVYYNVLNILGDRMSKNPGTTVTLIGSSDKGAADGRAMAESVKEYLVEVFKIDGSRITVKAERNPSAPTDVQRTGDDLKYVEEGERRVSIESNSPILLTEFRSGPSTPLRSVEVFSTQDAPLESYTTFSVSGAKQAYSSWTVEVKDEKGSVQYFGPYTQEKVLIPGKTILGTRAEGDYEITLVGITNSGRTVKKTTHAHMVLWNPPVDEEVMRYSVLYEFDEAKATSIYAQYLQEVVAPKIPQGGKVILHGHTDVIGEEDHNHALSNARANDVKAILEQALAKSNRTDVTFEVYGFGEDPSFQPFENKYPEQRSYNRTVVIDIIPK